LGVYNLIKNFSPDECLVKVGMELFTEEGKELVQELVRIGYKVFFDQKYFDIPNTVAATCEVAADLGVWMINVHALGGSKMMKEVMFRLNKRKKRPLVAAVTILTSMGQEDIKEIGLHGTVEENVLRLATLAKKCGLDGVVSSAKEAKLLREKFGADFNLVTPGIRFSDGNADDQVRIMTPFDTIKAGADYLVMGRPITKAKNPLAALERANLEIHNM